MSPETRVEKPFGFCFIDAGFPRQAGAVFVERVEAGMSPIHVDNVVSITIISQALQGPNIIAGTSTFMPLTWVDRQ